MKNILYIAALSAMTFSSCDFLDTEVYGSLDENSLYHTEASCLAGLSGVYDKLTAGGVYGQNLWGELDAGTDVTVYNRGYGVSYIQVSNNNYTNTDKTVETTWKDLYEGINRANDFIATIATRTDMECGGKQKKAAFLGEAKALRALYYMNLVAFWGEVPMRLTPTSDLSQQLLKKSPQPEIYKQIIADLMDAEQNCRPADELNAPGHVSKTTAQALLARAYMWQAGYPVEANTWGEALKWAREVKKSGLHHLYQETNGVNGYSALFINMCSNLYDLNDRESMFEVEFDGNTLDKTNEAGSVGMSLGIGQMAVVDEPIVGYAYAYYDATRMLAKMYEVNDARKWWVLGDYKYVKSTDGKSAVEVPLTEAELLNRSDNGGNPGKWRSKYDPIRPRFRNASSINYPVMRYADVLLMIAECANEVEGPTQEAVDAINEIRSRAKVSLVSADFFAGKEEFREFIREERTRELCFEVPRHMELRRCGKDYFFERIRLLKDQSKDENGKVIGYALTSIQAVPAINLEEKHLYLPIPQAELNTNPICGQNKNW